MRFRHSVVLALGFACLLGAAAEAQGRHLTTGARVRIALFPERAEDENDRLTGTITATSSDTVTVRVHSSVPPVAIPIASIERAHVSLGPESTLQGTMRGARVGLLIGALVGAMIGTEIANARVGPADNTALRIIGQRMLSYGLTFGIGGAIGGAARPGERWQRVPEHELASRPLPELRNLPPDQD